MIRRRTVLALPGLGLLAGACAADRPVPVAASHGPDEGGIGGTGIFGVLSAIDPLRLNGLAIATDAATVLEGPAGRAAPMPGEAVAVHALATPAGLRATRIAVFHALIGPLTVGPDGGLAVLGTRLLPDAGLVARDAQGRPHAVRTGQWVGVSGLWRDDAVQVSALRLLPTPAAGSAVVLRGMLRRRDGRFVVGRSVIDPVAVPVPPPLDRFVVVRGRATSSGLAVESLSVEPPPLLAARVRRLAVEGFLAPNGDTPGFHLAGFGLPVAPATPPPIADGRGLFLGGWDGSFRIEAGLPLPADPAARARALAAPDTDAALRNWLAGT
jgi:hypothetical protein